ncbi:hypothetical protein GDO81_027790 [Engystomops pustulosus]|uniref:Secreted protein n=1 Tax=Engystomops pustulosus TaxID=76066 RepID=A0AAV6Z3Q6_ENGPU|nr:hypothetical protein GDO81_027790 [Engystomops pustulosus]
MNIVFVLKYSSFVVLLCFVWYTLIFYTTPPPHHKCAHMKRWPHKARAVLCFYSLGNFFVNHRQLTPPPRYNRLIKERVASGNALYLVAKEVTVLRDICLFMMSWILPWSLQQV